MDRNTDFKRNSFKVHYTRMIVIKTKEKIILLIASLLITPLPAMLCLHGKISIKLLIHSYMHFSFIETSICN